jgi:hypothetical protein
MKPRANGLLLSVSMLDDAGPLRAYKLSVEGLTIRADTGVSIVLLRLTFAQGKPRFIVCQILISDVEYRFAPEVTTKRRTGRRTTRAIGLVLLSIAIMALLLTDADAKRRSSAQGSQAAGASRSWCATYSWKGINDNCSFATQQQCLAQVWGLGGFCRPNPFPGTAYGTGYTWGSGPVR